MVPLAISFLIHFELSFSFNLYVSVADKLSKALPDSEELAKLLPDLDKIGESFSFLKNWLSSGKGSLHDHSSVRISSLMYVRFVSS